MQTSVLGKTGLKVSKLAFGGLFVMSNQSQFEEARKAIHRAVELGINYFDTAPNYGDSEAVLGKVFPEIKQPFVLSTKLGNRPKPFNPKDKAALRSSVEESLRLLGRDHVDILMVHEPDRPGQYDWWTNWDDLAGPVLDLMGELKKEGIIRYTGLGGTTVYEMAHLCRSAKFDVVLTAYNYSLLYREAGQHVIPAAKKMNMGVVVGSPLHQGALSRRYDELMAKPPYWLSPQRVAQFKTLYAFVDECGLSLAELGLRFVLSNPDVDCTLMGARSVAEVEQNVAAAEKGPLPRDIIKRLDEIAAQVPYRPFCEPFGLGWVMPTPGKHRGPGA
jgi:aryl-alcohol dehydrogenase-like predicted oxidoreductase